MQPGQEWVPTMGRSTDRPRVKPRIARPGAFRPNPTADLAGGWKGLPCAHRDARAAKRCPDPVGGHRHLSRRGPVHPRTAGGRRHHRPAGRDHLGGPEGQAAASTGPSVPARSISLRPGPSTSTTPGCTRRLPRTATAQRTATQRIAKKNIRPGDLVFVLSATSRVTHVLGLRRRREDLALAQAGGRRQAVDAVDLPLDRRPGALTLLGVLGRPGTVWVP